jgi:transcription factor CRZ1
MDPTNRGRSPSVNASTHLSHSPSPSPHQGFRNPSVTGLGLQQTVAFSDSTPFNGQLTGSHETTFDGALDFSSVSQSFPDQNAFAQNSLFQDQGLAQANASAQQFNQDTTLFSEFSNLNDTTGINGSFDGPLFPSTEDSTDYLGPTALDPRLLDQQQAQQTNDPNSLMAQMTTQAQSPTPPHLLSPAMHRQSSQSPHGSPALNQGAFQSHSPGHSRNTSLDPSSAAYPQMQGWGGGDAFRGHRRVPSDAHSDVSSSAHPSPYLGNMDSFENPISNHSPLLGAQQDPAMYRDVVQPIEQFSISQGPNPYISPAHSPIPSPQLNPQQHPLPAFTSADNFGLGQQGGIVAPMPTNFNGMQSIGFLPSQNQDQFPEFAQRDMGYQSETMSPPEINIQLAPPSRQTSFEPPKPEGVEDGLSPPERSTLIRPSQC